MKNLDWGNLSFGYMKTDYNVRCYYRDGKWGEIEVCSDEYLNLHMAATCLHYGQEAFEGLKAYRCKDGKVRIFRVKDNAERLQSTCRGILMPELPTEMFVEMVKKVVRLNQEWIPTYAEYLPFVLPVGKPQWSLSNKSKHYGLLKSDVHR